MVLVIKLQLASAYHSSFHVRFLTPLINNAGRSREQVGDEVRRPRSPRRCRGRDPDDTGPHALRAEPPPADAVALPNNVECNHWAKYVITRVSIWFFALLTSLFAPFGLLFHVASDEYVVISVLVNRPPFRFLLLPQLTRWATASTTWRNQSES